MNQAFLTSGYGTGHSPLAVREGFRENTLVQHSGICLLILRDINFFPQSLPLGNLNYSHLIIVSSLHINLSPLHYNAL
jgi:hypothetical protein